MRTNFFQIEILNDSFEVQRTDYSEQKLKDLRAKYNPRASFFRNDDYIYVSPSLGSGVELGDRHAISAQAEPQVVASLIRHIFFRKFREMFPALIPHSFSPLRFASERDRFDPIKDQLNDDLAEVIGYPRLVEVNVRSIVRGKLHSHGLVYTFRNRWRFNLSLQQVLDFGFDVCGCTVVESVDLPGLHGVLAPDETLLGEVLSAENGKAVIKTNDGNVERPTSLLMLERTSSQIGRFLEHIQGTTKTRELFTAIRNTTESKSNQNYLYGQIHAIAGFFAKQEYRNDDNFCFAVTTDSQIDDASFQLERTRLLFDYSPGATAYRPLGGLRQYGPYDSTRFDKRSVSILLVVQDKNRGSATEAMERLREGIPSSKYFQMGLRSLFRLSRVDFYPKSISECTPEAYERAIDDAVKSAKQPYDLAIVECPDNSQDFPNESNPYLRAKHRLFQYGIPVQGIRECHLCASLQSQGTTFGPMALQIYAKLGGVPWLLPSSQSVDHEMIIGIGNAVIRENQWHGVEQSRIVGMTTFFLGEGRYILGKEISSVPYEEYFQSLLVSLEESLREISAQNGWKEHEAIRLVFHVFKPLKDVEVDVVAELIKRFPQFDIKFAFVTVSMKHPWLLFRKARYDGKVEDWEVTAAERCDNLVLDDRSCLLQLKGPNDRSNRQQPIPPPVLMRIHEKSTYFDLHFIAQQLLDFSFLSWKSFFPVGLPVTIEYSNEMARLSAKLASLPGWNPAITVQNLRETKWFL
jgi:hypothetical protein